MISKNADSLLPVKKDWHPFALLLFILSTMILYSAFDTIGAELFVAACIITVLVAFSVTPPQVFSQISIFLWLLPFTFIMHAVFSSAGLEFIRSLMEGNLQFVYLQDAIRYTLRIFVFIYLMGAVFILVHMQKLLDASAGLLSPLGKIGIPVNNFFQILTIGLRFFPVLKEESLRLQEVRESLGIQTPKKLSGRIRSHMANLVPIFVSTMHRAEIVAHVMKLRGYNAARQRTLYKRVPWRYQDSALSTLSGLLLIAARMI